MLRLFCFFCAAQALACSSLAAPASSSTDSGGTPPASAALPPELQAELDALANDRWHPSAALRASLGWRDNVLLSPFTPIERGFARAELDAMLLRPMENRWEFISFLNGDVLRYFSPPTETRGEQQWAIHTEGRWQMLKQARFSLKGAAYLSDMVIDLSETEASRVVAPTRVQGAYAAAAPRLTWRRFVFEPSVQIKRTDYREYAGDYDEVRAGGRVEWRQSDAFALSVAFLDSRRDYDQRMQYNAGGRALPGTHLRFHQRDGEVKVRTGWELGGEWALSGTVGQLENRDEASGYFDYDQKRARVQLDWSRGSWRVNLDADARRVDYLVQTVGAGIAPPPRISDDYEITLGFERDLSEQWMVFGQHRWERSRSNELEFSYRANTVLAGVQRSF